MAAINSSWVEDSLGKVKSHTEESMSFRKADTILLIRNAYPITLGANLGTTVTALLAALAAGTISGLTIAITHTLFNLAAIAILYPWQRIRYIPVTLAGYLADVAVKNKLLALSYVLVVFILLPLAVIVVLSQG